MGGRTTTGVLLATALACAGCGLLPSVQRVTGGTALAAPGSGDSMIFLAPTDAGPVVIDLGWTGAGATLLQALRAHGWSADDVAAVFLTHAHRDHIGAWRLLRDAPFYLAGAEVPLLTGQELPPGPLDRMAARIRPPPRPTTGELDLRTFDGDTVIPLGGDTVRAFPVPGHTRGSAAYLLRGVLFIGDAGSPTLLGELGPPAAAYSMDAAGGARSLAGLLDRVAELDVRYVCTAHARCYTYEDARSAAPRPPPPR